ncbi:hypothetical protein V8E55_002626 [Tylopilus felleus]
MTSALQSFLELVQLSDYASVAVFTALGYDYILTFSREVEYIWCQRWTWVSTTFLLTRYLGLCWAVMDALIGSSFLPGPVKVSTTVYLVGIWAFVVFLSVADLMMVLRVYAMWNRSRTILCVLLLIYIAQTIICFIFAGIYINTDTYLSVTIVQYQYLPDSSFKFCGFLLNVPPNLTVYFMIPRFVLSAVLLLLALARTLKESAGMYKATRQWQPNRYMELFTRDGVVYFFTSLLYNTLETILSGDGFLATNPPMVLLDYFVYLLFATIMPRFLISVRELYVRDLKGSGRFYNFVCE